MEYLGLGAHLVLLQEHIAEWPHSVLHPLLEHLRTLNPRHAVFTPGP